MFRFVKAVSRAVLISCSIAVSALGEDAGGNPVDRYNVLWDSPSKDAKGSMPIGNGDIGLNVWVEPSGDLCFFIGKTDAWDENQRLLKLGKVRVRLTPALATTPGFRQELKLRDGVIEISNPQTRISVWVDANHPVIHVDAKSSSGQPLEARATFEVWRKEKRSLGSPQLGGSGEYFSTGYTATPAFSYPDTTLPATARRIGWYHRNMESPWLASLKLQKNEALAKTEQDPILNRTMGAILHGDHFVSASDTELRTEMPAPELALRIDVLTQITDTPEQWLAALEQQADVIEKIPAAKRQQEHARWWQAYWDRSWIHVDGKRVKEERSDSAAEALTRAYTLQRFMNACGGRGAFPIKFNGSIFVVDNKFDADYRAWGGCYWFQNTRHSYWPMLTSGDFDLMQPFFDYYMRVLPARKLATKSYYGHDGAFFPETMSIWGNYTDQGDLGYGIDRVGKPDGLTDNTYVRRYWQGGLEIVVMMLDYHDLTQNVAFRDQTLLPFAREVITFFDQHWQRGADGKILFDPAQSLETWHTARNPLPEIAGLRYVIPRLLALPAAQANKTAWNKTLADLPLIPTHTDSNGVRRLAPAETYSQKKNVENPELYAVFPYRIHTLAAGKDALAIGKTTFASRTHRDNFCWRQDPIQAALLGLGDEAARDVAARATSVEPGFRFPAMWAAGSDWMPDQDHVGVMMTALQRMILQTDGDRILLLPAWPKDWNCSFKLHAPKNTTVQGVVKNGKIESLKVMPQSRAKDIVTVQQE